MGSSRSNPNPIPNILFYLFTSNNYVLKKLKTANFVNPKKVSSFLAPWGAADRGKKYPTKRGSQVHDKMEDNQSIISNCARDGRRKSTHSILRAPEGVLLGILLGTRLWGSALWSPIDRLNQQPRTPEGLSLYIKTVFGDDKQPVLEDADKAYTDPGLFHTPFTPSGKPEGLPWQTKLWPPVVSV